MEAGELLRDLAGKTANAPEPHGTGRYHYVHTIGAYVRTNRYLSRTGESTVTGTIEQSERKQWIAADGSGRLVVTQEGEEVVPPSGDYAPGSLPALFLTATDEASLAVELGKLNSKTTTSAIIKTFQQIWNLQVVTPALQRLLLLNLAKCTDLSVEPAPRNFAGKPGIAVTHLDQARHQQKFLIFSPETGELIGAQEIALEGARLPIPVPAVVSSTEWLNSGYRETTTES